MLTKRQAEVLQKLLKLYGESPAGVHYTVLARELGMSRWSAYEMLRGLEKRGLTQRRYDATSRRGRGGRPRVLFAPTPEGTAALVEALNREGAETEWSTVAETLLHQIGHMTSEEVHERLSGLREPSPLSRCAHLVTSLLVMARDSARDSRTAEALERIVVEYEDLPVVLDPVEAMQEGSPLLHPDRDSNIFCHYRIRKGDAEAALAEADVVIEAEYRTPAQEHAYLQPEAGLAYIDEEGRVTVEVAGQWTHEDREQIAHALGLAPALGPTAAPGAQGEGDVVANVEMRKQHAVLGHVPDVPLPRFTPGDVPAGNLDPPPQDAHQAAEALQQEGLSGPAGPDEDEVLSRADLQGNGQAEAAGTQAQILHADHRTPPVPKIVARVTARKISRTVTATATMIRAIASAASMWPMEISRYADVGSTSVCPLTAPATIMMGPKMPSARAQASTAPARMPDRARAASRSETPGCGCTPGSAPPPRSAGPLRRMTP